jgi:hypothetical protein
MTDNSIFQDTFGDRSKQNNTRNLGTNIFGKNLNTIAIAQHSDFNLSEISFSDQSIEGLKHIDQSLVEFHKTLEREQETGGI